MTKPIVRIHNSETDEVIDTEMTDAEFVKYEKEQAIFKAEVEVQAKARVALLAKLGITEAEARLLLA
jgi:hypothetical protein